MNIVFYSTHCPRCRVLQKKLNEKHLAYTECNDTEIMLRKGFRSSPMLEVDGVTMEFTQAVTWVNAQE